MLDKLLNSSVAEVRSNPDLLQFYVMKYTELYGREPDCLACLASAQAGLERFKADYFNKNKIKKNINMDKTFQFSIDTPDILTYINKDGKPVRAYSNKATDEYVINFLTHGKVEEIEERKKLFKKLPKGLTKESKEVKEPKAKK